MPMMVCGNLFEATLANIDAFFKDFLNKFCLFLSPNPNAFCHLQYPAEMRPTVIARPSHIRVVRSRVKAFVYFRNRE